MTDNACDDLNLLFKDILEVLDRINVESEMEGILYLFVSKIFIILFKILTS